jgi:Telomere resolvase
MNGFMAKTIPANEAEALAQRLREATDKTAIEAICREIEQAYFGEGDSQKTKNNKLAPLNKLMKEVPDSELDLERNAYIQPRKDGSRWYRHFYFKAIGLADVNWNGEGGINYDYEQKRISALIGKKEIPVNQYLETTKKLLQSTNPHELAVGLIAASGRRPIEIVSLGKFTLKKSFKDLSAKVLDAATNLRIEYYVDFQGQAKRDEYELPEGEKLKYPIGLLVPAKAFIAAFRRLRQTTEYLEIAAFVKQEIDKGTPYEAINAAIESRRGNSLRRVVAEEYGAFLPPKEEEKNVTCTTLRAAYVRLITDRDCPKNIDELMWASRSVGHFIDVESPDKNKLIDLITTLSYRYFYSDSEVPFIEISEPETEKTRALHTFISDIEIIEQLKAQKGFTSNAQVIRESLTLATRAEYERNEFKQELEAKNAEIARLRGEITAVQNQVKIQEETPMLDVDLDVLIEAKVEAAIAKIMDRLQTVKPEVQPEPVKPVAQVSQVEDWQAKTDAELWKSRAKEATEEKIRRSCLAVMKYNDEVATGDDDRLAVTNTALRELSGCNGLAVGDWLKSHADEVISHNCKHQMGNAKDPTRLETYYNKKHGAAKVTQILDLINQEFLSGEGLRKQA